MTRNWKHCMSYGMAVISFTAIIAAVSACSAASSLPSASPPAASSQPITTGQPTVTTASQPAPPTQQNAPNQPAPAPSGAAALNRPAGQGASGTIITISSNALTLNTEQGQVTVNLGSNIPVQETVTGSLSDLQVNQTLIVMGSPDSTGNISANTIMIQSTRNQFTPPTGANPGMTNQPGRTSSGQNPNFPNNANRGTFGTLANINGNTLTLTTNQGQQVTVDISGSTVINKTITGSISDLKEGQFISVMGTRDASNNLTASAIVVRPQNSNQPAPSSGS